MNILSYIIEILVSLFDAVFCVYFISRFNKAPLSPRKNKFIIPSATIIFLFSIINDLFLTGFNILGTLIFLGLYIGYAMLVSGKKYIRALLSACIFEIVFVLLSSLLYLIITFIIKDYDQLAQGSNGIFRYIYLAMHKIALFVILKLILLIFNEDGTVELRHGILFFCFSFATILGLGSTMYAVSLVNTRKMQIQAVIIALTLTFANVALYLLIYQIQKYQRSKYELRLLQEKIELDEARHNEASTTYQEMRRIQHDMRQHLTVLSAYLEEESYDDCREYLSKILPFPQGAKSLKTSDNMLLDYLITSKLSSLKDTEVIVSGSIGDLSDIKDKDLACLIGNILDNAVEAIENVKRSQKRIELLFLRQNSNRIIICKNTIEKSVLSENSELKTTKEPKEGHGLGTKIIAKIVSDYGGMVDYFEELDMFGVQVVLPERFSPVSQKAPI